MKNSGLQKVFIFTCLILISSVLLSGCMEQNLSSIFNEEEVEKAGEQVVLLLNQRDSDGLWALSDPQLEAALTDDVLEGIYQVLSGVGPFEGFEQVRVAGMIDRSIGNDFAVATVKARYQNKSLTYTIIFNEQMDLVGLYYQ